MPTKGSYIIEVDGNVVHIQNGYQKESFILSSIDILCGVKPVNVLCGKTSESNELVLLTGTTINSPRLAVLYLDYEDFGYDSLQEFCEFLIAEGIGGGTPLQRPLIVGNYELPLDTLSTLTIIGFNFTPSTVFEVTGGTGTISVNSVNYINENQVELEIQSSVFESTYTLSATNGALTSEQTDNLIVQDPDAIRRSLSGASLTAYDAANNGDWIAISEAEWDTLKIEVSNTNTFGTSDADQRTGPVGNFAAGNRFTFGQTTNPSLSNQYFFAFRFGNNRPLSVANSDKIRISANGVSDWLQVGILSQNGIADNGFQYFVLKGNSTIMPTPSFLGLSTNATDLNMYFDADNTEGVRAGGDSDNPNNPGFGWSMSGLSTNVIQWAV